MTELLIDGVAVALPKDLSTQVKRENPFFTKNGEYTYDITLRLDNPVNAELYGHLNRLNSVQELKSKRTAMLISDNRVYCNGTEIVTGWTDKSVSIQIVSGNSELNYLTGSSLEISFLKMPVTSPLVNGKPEMKRIELRYPEIDYCLSPVIDRANEKTVNEWIINIASSTRTLSFECKPVIAEYDYIPQPFLCSYIKELLKALDYDLVVNAIEETCWKDLCITHVNRTYNWSEMLPGWSVCDFLEEVEKMFNVCFVVDNRKRTVRLMLRSYYYQNTTVAHVVRVADEFEVNDEEENESYYDYRNKTVMYKFPDNSYFRQRCIPESISQSVKRGVIPSSVVQLGTWFNHNADVSHLDKNVIFTWETDEREYVFSQNWASDADHTFSYIMLNEFKNLDRKDATETIELEMMPAEIEYCSIYFYNDHVVTKARARYALPVVDGKTIAEEGEAPASIVDQLESGVSEESASKENIFLVFHHGLIGRINEVIPTKGINYPMPFTDEYIQNIHTSPTLTNTEGATLRLQKFEEICFGMTYDIDCKNPVKIVSYDPNVYDPRVIFEIKNKRYVCKDTEYTLTKEGRKGAWTGIFYPIKISDVEADTRWILTDGKWRDGGVWLDNGRWMDG